MQRKHVPTGIAYKVYLSDIIVERLKDIITIVESMKGCSGKKYISRFIKYIEVHHLLFCLNVIICVYVIENIFIISPL